MATKKAAAKTKAPRFYAMSTDYYCSAGYDTAEAALDFAAEDEWFDNGNVTILQEIGVYRQSVNYEEVNE